MPTDLQAILRIEVPVIVLIGKHTLKVDEVRNLSPGAILELPTTTDDELEILINNQPVAMGRALKVGENFGVRLTYVGDVRQRIHAMGAPGSDPTPAPGSDPAPGNTAAPSGAGGENATSRLGDGEDADALADEVLAGE